MLLIRTRTRIIGVGIPQAMKQASSLVLSMAAWALVASTLLVATASATPSGQSPGQQPPAASDPAADPAAGLFWQTCGECHDGTRIVSTRRTKPEWEQVIHKMIEEGASGSAKDFETIFGYLLRHHGKVFINTATPDEISMIVGISKKDAEAIVAARKASGSFADLEAVKKVPDIDVKALDEHKDAVAF